MKLLLLLAIICLSSHLANSQAIPQLSSIVVTLKRGETARQQYVCMDTATYRVTREQVAQVVPLRQRVALLEYDRQLLEKQVADGRQATQIANQDFDAAQAQARVLEAVPRRPLLLLDSRLYLGAAAGIVLGELARILLFHSW